MKKQEMMLNGSTLKIETGQVARQSSGSVIVSHGETTILVAVNAAPKAPTAPLNIIPSTPRFNTPLFSVISSPVAANSRGIDVAIIVNINASIIF